MRMQPVDRMGALYSSDGLRFGGFQTAQFFEMTDDLEDIRPGVREEIVAEAHYLVHWLHVFPEIGFFLGTIISKSLLVGFICFVVAYILEIIRFYTLRASPVISKLCYIWNWIKIPLFVGAAILLWPQGKLIPIIFILFLILQCKLMLISVIAMLPIKLLIGLWIFKKYNDPYMNNMEALAMGYVLDRWRMELLIPEEVIK